MQSNLPVPRRVFVALSLSLLTMAGGAVGAESANGISKRKQDGALLIGIRFYPVGCGFTRLKHSWKGVDEFAEALRVCGYDVVKMTDRTTTPESLRPEKENIKAQIRKMASEYEGRIVVFLTGHGKTVANAPHFVTWLDQSRFEQDKPDESEYTLAYSEIEKLLGAGTAHSKFVFADACRDEQDKAPAFKAPEESPPPKVYTVYSCSPGGKSYEDDRLGPSGHSVFTWYLIREFYRQAKHSAVDFSLMYRLIRQEVETNRKGKDPQQPSLPFPPAPNDSVSLADSHEPLRLEDVKYEYHRLTSSRLSNDGESPVEKTVFTEKVFTGEFPAKFDPDGYTPARKITHFKGAVFNSCTFENCQFNETQMEMAEFYNCYFFNCQFNNTGLTGAKFFDCEFDKDCRMKLTSAKIFSVTRTRGTPPWSAMDPSKRPDGSSTD